MEITPELPDGYEGQIKRLQCLHCKRYFYIPREYFDTHHPTHCHECSLILRPEIQKAQPKRDTRSSQTAAIHHPRTIDREKMTAVQLIKEGRAYEKAGQYKEALLSYTQAVQKDPKNIYTYWSRAGVLAHLSRLDEALAVYDQAIQLEPSNFIAYSYKALTLQQNGHVEDALATYDQCIERNPTVFDGYYWKVYLLSEQKRDTEALAMIVRYLLIDPAHREAIWWKASLLQSLNRSDEALSCVEDAIQRFPVKYPKT